MWLALNNFAIGADFQYVTESDSSVFQIDFDSIANVQKYKKAWMITNHYELVDALTVANKKYKSTKTLWYFDCDAKLAGQFHTAKYEGEYASGKVVETRPLKFNSAMLDDIAPDTVGETILNTGCGSPASRAKIKAQNAATLVRLLQEMEKAKLNRQ